MLSIRSFGEVIELGSAIHDVGWRNYGAKNEITPAVVARLAPVPRLKAILPHLELPDPALPLAKPYVHLDWDCEQAPVLRLHRAGGMATDLDSLLDKQFDAAGAFRRWVPNDFLRFAETVRVRDDLDLEDEALTHARRLADDAPRAAHAADIRERIDAGGGQLAGVRPGLHPSWKSHGDGLIFLSGFGLILSLLRYPQRQWVALFARVRYGQHTVRR